MIAPGGKTMHELNTKSQAIDQTVNYWKALMRIFTRHKRTPGLALRHSSLGPDHVDKKLQPENRAATKSSTFAP